MCINAANEITASHSTDDLLGIVRGTSDALAGCGSLAEALSLGLSQIQKTNDWGTVGIATIENQVGSSFSVEFGKRLLLAPERFPEPPAGSSAAGGAFTLIHEQSLAALERFDAASAFGAQGVVPLMIDRKIGGVVHVGSKWSDPIPTPIQDAVTLIARELARVLAELNISAAAWPHAGKIEPAFESMVGLLGDIQEAVVAFDLEGVVAFWSHGAEKLYGYTMVEALGRSVFDLLAAPGTAGEEKRRLEQAVRRGSWSGQCLRRRKDGASFWGDRFIFLVRGLNDRPVGFIGLDRDITRRKNLEKELFEARETLRLLVDTNPASLILIDPEGRIVTANQKLADRFKRPLQDIIGGNVYDLVPPELIPMRRKWVETVLEIKRGVVFEDERDGLALEHHLNPVLDEAGRVVYLAISAFDLTERRGREFLIRQMNEKLDKSQKFEALGSLAGAIVHDFNNILWGIIGFAEMTLKEAPAGGSVHENLRGILKAAKRAKDLVEQILVYSRREGADQTKVSLNDVIAESIEFMEKTFPRSLKIQSRPPEEPCIILGNSTQLHQVVFNICNNSRQAFQDDCGCIDIALTQACPWPGGPDLDERVKTGGYARLSLSDDGSGIDEKVVNRIFEPFYSTKPPGEGSGLGLAVVQRIVKDHHGFIEVKSRPGRGTAFVVYLPLCDGSVEEADNEARTLSGGRECILFVDDERLLIEMFSRYLGKLGYDVVARSDPLEAYIDFENDPDGFDLVILDYIMPVMNGLELARKIKTLRPKIPVILLTGNALDLPPPPPREEAPVNYILAKPISNQEIASIIRRTLDESHVIKNEFVYFS
ncbi:MAG: PAS domain S-box protein [Pseudomonadota bacterium]